MELKELMPGVWQTVPERILTKDEWLARRMKERAELEEWRKKLERT